MQSIYFDNAASTKSFLQAVEVFKQSEEEFYANCSSTHTLGKASGIELEKAREKIASVLSVDLSKYHIIFTSGASESNALIMQSVLKRKQKSNVVISNAEHESIKANSVILETFGISANYVSSSKGFVQSEKLIEKIDKDTALVSVIHTNNVTGSINDIAQLSKSVKQKSPKTVFHTDATQAVFSLLNGEFNVLTSSGVDALSLSSHKLYAPKGLGILIIKNNLNPQLSSAGGQQYGIRGGTEPLSLIKALSTSLEILKEKQSEFEDNITRLSNYFLSFCEKEKRIKVLREENRDYSPTIVCISAKNIPGEVMQRMLSEKNIMVGTTSACSANSKKKSGILNEMGYNYQDSNNAIRISIGVYNTIDEMKCFCECISQICKEF